MVTIRRKPEQAFKAVGGVTEQVSEQVQKLLIAVMGGPESSATLMEALRLSQPSFLYSYLQPAITAKLVEMTIPDKPQSSKQKYRLTTKGATFVSKLEETKGDGK